MPQPRRAPGTHGAITTTRDGTGWRARARYRDHRGRAGMVERRGRTRGAARSAVQTALGELLPGDTPTSGTVSELMKAYLDGVTVGESSLKRYRSAWRALEPELGGLTIAECTPTRISRAYQRLADSGKDVRPYRAILRGAFDHGIRTMGLTSNPAKAAPSPRLEKAAPSRRTVDAGSLPSIIRACDEYPEKGVPTLGVLARVLVATGGRVSEALALNWDEWAHDSRTLTLGHHLNDEGKRLAGRKGGAAPLAHQVPGALAEMLEERRERIGGSLVFPSRAGGYRTPNNVGRSFRAALKRAGLPLVGFHAFRRGTVTAVRQSIGRRAAQDVAGHRLSSTTETHYVQRGAKAPDVTRVTRRLLFVPGVWDVEWEGEWWTMVLPDELVGLLPGGSPEEKRARVDEMLERGEAEFNPHFYPEWGDESDVPIIQGTPVEM